MVTDSEDDLDAPAVSPMIRVTYAARINNDLVTDAGDTLANDVSLYYLNGETGAEEVLTDAAAAITATEPVLTAAVTLTNATSGKAAGDPLEVNDLAEYVITIVNGGGATAYDVNVVDTLPVELALLDAYTPTAEINAAPVAGFVATPAGAPRGPLVWGRGNGDDSLDIPAGAFLELTFQARMQIPAENGNALENSVLVPSATVTERKSSSVEDDFSSPAKRQPSVCSRVLKTCSR